METMSLAEAKKFWADYEENLHSLRMRDAQMQAAFGVDPHSADAFERDFWRNYAKVEPSLPESQRYSD